MTALTDRIDSSEFRLELKDGDSVSRSFILDGKTGVSGISASLGAGSVLDLSLIVLPGQDCDIDIKVDMEGQGSEVHLSGIYLCPGEEKVRIRTFVNHKVPHCTSRQLFKGMAGGHARTDFYGLIIVAQDAQKTEAYQENHNLLLSDGARMETRPQLEIYADDVKCSHGATVGKLNEEEQFYMRSRGIPEKEARVLQMLSFISPVISHIPDLSVRDDVEKAAVKAITEMEL